jgi:3-hydroxyisobutyrate dehydrogenase-like beta-hydroxyacid dehydrogenase
MELSWTAREHLVKAEVLPESEAVRYVIARAEGITFTCKNGELYRDFGTSRASAAARAKGRAEAG